MSIASNERGMTLIEILAVVTIIAIVAVVIGGGIFEKADVANAKLNKVKIGKVKDALGQYRLSTGKYPSSLEELTRSKGSYFAVLREKQSDDEPGDLEDVWGQPYQYSAKGGGLSYELKSYGADGKAGGEGVNADLVVQP